MGTAVKGRRRTSAARYGENLAPRSRKLTVCSVAEGAERALTWREVDAGVVGETGECGGEEPGDEDESDEGCLSRPKEDINSTNEGRAVILTRGARKEWSVGHS